MSELLTPFEWFFVVLLGVIPLGGAVFHLWVMFIGHGKKTDASSDSESST